MTSRKLQLLQIKCIMGDDLHINKQSKQTNIFIASHRHINIEFNTVDYIDW
jgi:hypothetical protein